MANSQFVVIKKRNFEEALSEMFNTDWKEITSDINGTMEAVYQLPTSNDALAIRIYSSIDIRTNTSRDIGTDAIRVVFWDLNQDRPFGKTKRIHRTEGRTTVYERIQQRIKEFLNDSHQVEMIDYNYVKAVLEVNDWNNFAQDLLKSLKQYGRLTPRQLMYVLGDEPINGKPTLEMRAKSSKPNFFMEWQEQNMEVVEMEVDIVDDEDSEENITMPVERPRESLSEFVNRLAELPTFDEALEGMQPRYETEMYEHYQYPFEFFNPVQSKVFPIRNDNSNFVIGASTSAGKTICAELMMDKVLDDGHKIIYLSPLKSLTQEKYDDWKVRFAERKIVILTGDYTLSEKMKRDIGEADIVVMTSEMMDSRTRRMKMEGGNWLLDVRLVIVDESHIIATDRGHAVEAGLMRFTRINPAARVVLLSATMPNVDDLGQWLTRLNLKRTEVINSTWRPVQLNIDYVPYKVVRASMHGGMNYQATQANKIKEAVRLAREKMNEKYLIFVHDKTTGRKIVKALNSAANYTDLGEFKGEAEDCGNPAVFHNADLDLSERLDLERGFADRGFAEGVFSGTRVLVSTSTLAWGRNLPARNVIVVGVNRGLDEVHEYDIIQMSGRAGRYGIDDKGFVSILLPDNAMSYYVDRIEHPRPLQSTLSRPDILAFHAISEIDARHIKTPDNMVKWYNRSFAQQQEPMAGSDACEIFGKLIEMEMIITENSPTPRITGLGKVCSWLYFSPFDVFGWYNNVRNVLNADLLRERPDAALSYILGNVPCFDYGYIPKDCQEEGEYFVNHLKTLFGFDQVRDGTAAYLIGIMAALDGRDKEEIPISARTTGRSIKWDIRRINQALKLIDSMHGKWELDHIWKALPERINYGIPHHLAELCAIPDIGGKRAKRLWSKGFKSVADIADQSKLKKLSLILQPKLAKRVQAAARDMLTVVE